MLKEQFKEEERVVYRIEMHQYNFNWLETLLGKKMSDYYSKRSFRFNNLKQATIFLERITDKIQKEIESILNENKSGIKTELSKKNTQIVWLSEMNISKTTKQNDPESRIPFEIRMTFDSKFEIDLFKDVKEEKTIDGKVFSRKEKVWIRNVNEEEVGKDTLRGLPKYLDMKFVIWRDVELYLVPETNTEEE